MKPERNRQIDELFQAAIEQRPEDRCAFLDQACAGDPQLRKEVEALLASDEQAHSFIESPALEIAPELVADTHHTTVTGKVIGPYRLGAPLGSGGMGKVYLAHDMRLGRRVALKLLDPALVGDLEQRTRFLREARLASTLDHPNICAVHEVGEAGGRLFIAMQYVEGETLRQIIGGRPVALDSLLSISLQVADALAEAHEQGIIHRDIKAGNIIVTPKGQAKVLDFGLAKLLERAEGEAETHLTMTGAVMGTPASMSPEQARGERADRRSDIFSFGVVLYEMATGQTPFSGRSRADVISALLKEAHTPAAELNKDVPVGLSAVIDRALVKEPAERCQSMPDMIADLRRVVAEAGGLDHLFKSSDVPRGVVPLVPLRSASILSAFGRPVRKQIVAASLAAVVLALALAFFSIWLYRLSGRSALRQAARKSSPTVHFHTIKITRLTTVGTATAASVSPDGKYVAYATGEAVRTGFFTRWPAGRSGLWVKQVSTDSAVEIVPAADVQYKGTTFSRDGEHIYYVAVDEDNPSGALYQVPVLGGTPRKILTHINCPVTFSPDGKQFSFVRNYPNEGGDALVVSAVDGTGERTLAERKGNDWFEEDGPAWSPDGRTIACAVGTDTGGTSMTVVEVPAAGGEPKLITSHRWRAIGRVAWLGDGSGLALIAGENFETSWSGTDTQIWHIAYPGGEARRITNDLNGYSHTSLGLTSDSRAIVTAQEDTSARIWTATLDSSFAADAARQITGGKFEGRHGLSWSPDGRIVYVTRVGEDEDVWIMNGDGTAQRQVTDDAAFDDTPVVSPNGRHIYFSSTRSGIQQIWRIDADGDNPRQLTGSSAISYEPAISPDGRWIVFSSWRSGALSLWKMPAEGGEPARLTDSAASRAVFSPDGKFISCAYFDEEGVGQWRLAIISTESGRPVKILGLSFQTINALAGLQWTPDNRAVIYVDTRRGVSNVWRQMLDDRPPKQLTRFDSGQIFNLALTLDGRRLALARGGVSGDVVLISSQK